MVDTNKKVVYESVQMMDENAGYKRIFDDIRMDGMIEEVVDRIRDLADKAKDAGYWDIRLVLHERWEDIGYSLEGKRYETDAELKKRIKLETKFENHQKAQQGRQKIKDEKKERMEYERLKKKYG